MTQPTSTTDADRLRAVAAIHAFADWLKDNHDIPVPTQMVAHAHADHVQEVYDFADAHYLEVRSPSTDTASTTRWVNIQAATRLTHGIDIRYSRIGS